MRYFIEYNFFKINEDDDKIIEADYSKITVGGCSPGQRGVDLGAAPVVTAVFAVK